MKEYKLISENHGADKFNEQVEALSSIGYVVMPATFWSSPETHALMVDGVETNCYVRQVMMERERGWEGGME